MGNTTSGASAGAGTTAAAVDPRMLGIWQKLAYIQSDEARISMLETLMVGPEYINAAKRGGVYSFILRWIAAYRRGERPVWPGQQQHQQQPQRQTYPHQSYSPQADPRIPAMNAPRKMVKENTAIATVPPPKRALDALHQAYEDLGIDDTKPLTYDSLRAAYKKAASRTHPDRGGSSEEFDQITRSFLFLEEIINKLVPKKSDYSEPVTMEAALKARDVPLTRYAAEESARSTEVVHYNEATAAARQRQQHQTHQTYQPQTHQPQGQSRAAREDGPPVALNPKKLDMNLFNKLFEENRLPDPEDDGYGDWLKSSGEDTRVQNADTLRSKFNRDVFNRAFVEQSAASIKSSATSLTRHQVPDAIVHTQGVELGGGRPSHFISAMGAKTGYTDLKYAYGEGATFSQHVENINWETGKKSFEQMKHEREAAPEPLSEREAALVASIDSQKVKAEEERQRRMAARDVETEDIYTKMKRRLLIQS